MRFVPPKLCLRMLWKFRHRESKLFFAKILIAMKRLMIMFALNRKICAAARLHPLAVLQKNIDQLI